MGEPGENTDKTLPCRVLAAIYGAPRVFSDDLHELECRGLTLMRAEIRICETRCREKVAGCTALGASISLSERHAALGLKNRAQDRAQTRAATSRRGGMSFCVTRRTKCSRASCSGLGLGLSSYGHREWP